MSLADVFLESKQETLAESEVLLKTIFKQQES